MKRRMFGLALATALIVGLIAPAASAGNQGVAALSGVARVGSEIESCTKDVLHDPTGPGILTPNQAIPTPAEDNYKFSFRVPDPALGGALVAVGVDSNRQDGGVYQGNLKVCGSVTGVGGGTLVSQRLGAWCGMSKGFNGLGKLTLNPIESVTGRSAHFNLSDIGWKASAGTILPVFGKWRRQDGTTAGNKGTKTLEYGNIVGFVSARSLPGQQSDSCANAGGGQRFNVEGAVALVSQPGKAKGDVIRANNLPGMGKGGDNPIYGDKPKAPNKGNG